LVGTTTQQQHVDNHNEHNRNIDNNNERNRNIVRVVTTVTMNNDPADIRASARASLGLTRELERTRAVLPDPSRGGPRGYPVHDRIYQLTRAALGQETRASAASIWRWQQRLQPFRMTGNKQRNTIIGIDQFLLAIAITIWPDLTIDEMAVFIYREGGGIYSRQAISARLSELEISRKVTSTEAYQAYTPTNLLKERLFWTSPPPLELLEFTDDKSLM
jgi:hypothetical protein